MKGREHVDVTLAVLLAVGAVVGAYGIGLPLVQSPHLDPRLYKELFGLLLLVVRARYGHRFHGHPTSATGTPLYRWRVQRESPSPPTLPAADVSQMLIPEQRGLSKFVSIDEESDHEIVHALRLGEAKRAADEPLDPDPQIDMFALDFLRVLLAHLMLLVGPQPSV